jgi:hypothetical protein
VERSDLPRELQTYSLGVLSAVESLLVSQVLIRQYFLQGQQLVFHNPGSHLDIIGEKSAGRRSISRSLYGEWDIAMDGVQPNDLDDLGIVILTGLKGMNIRENISSGGDWVGGPKITNFYMS